MRRCTLSLLSMIIVAGGMSLNVAAGDVVPPVRDRFSDADVDEIPDFQRHLVPLLGKLGCNGRACHGSFQGAGGFQLSLFGYDFQMDHKNLLERVDTDDLADSYALHKPTLQDPHEGGQRLNLDSWEYRLFLNWIQGGASGLEEEPQKLVKLEVTPRELLFSEAGQTQQLQAIAVWEDGTREDVTCISRLSSNDDAICNVTDEGLVTSGDVGDSHVVVFYDNAVAPIPVIRPVSEKTGPNYPDVAAKTEIDRHVVSKLRKLGIVPSEVCSDADFIRRVTLDVTGTLPSAARVREFLADSTPDKRARLVDELLETPAYAAWWTTQLSDWTGANDQQLNNVNPGARQAGSQDWYDWIYRRVEQNVPYDELVENIVLATSRQPGESYREYSERMSDYHRRNDLSFADNDGLIYFWGRQNFRTNEDRAVGFAYTFMGTRIQCAQCHKHPFDVWTQDDFKQFEQFFSRVNFARNGTDRREYRAILEELGVTDLVGGQQRNAISRAAREGKTVPYPELVVTPPRGENARRGPRGRQRNRNARVAQSAKLLGEQEVDLGSIEDPRTALMDWLRESPTKLFAKAFVNRVWANYFNRGIVEPTDDLSLANPPCNEDLLNHLADGFIANGYDMKWVHREIVLSETYQRSWQPNETNLHDERNFSRAVPRRLPAEVAYDALIMATSYDERAATFATDLAGRATLSTSPPRNNNIRGPNYALTVFGRSTRESACDCDRSSEASLLQTLYVRNDAETLEMLTRRDGWVSQLERTFNPEATARERGNRGADNRQFAQLQQRLRAARQEGNRRQAARIQSRLAELRRAGGNEAAQREPRKFDVDANLIVEEAYLRTVSRFPTGEELESAASYITEAEDTFSGIRDVMWALINTKEFIVNH